METWREVRPDASVRRIFIFVDAWECFRGVFFAGKAEHDEAG